MSDVAPRRDTISRRAHLDGPAERCAALCRIRSRRRYLPAALAAGMLALSAAPARAAGDRITPRIVAELRLVTGVAMSPDGRHIAYVLTVPRQPFDEDDGPPWTELHVADQDGRCRPFVTGAVNVGRPRWTADGAGISFTAKRGKDEHTSLYVIPLGGGEARRVLSHGEDIGVYDWSPDGRQVAFLASAPQSKEHKELEKKGFAAVVVEEDWRPVEVWTATPGAENGKAVKLPIDGSAHAVRWSPDGTRLAVAVAPTPLVDDEYMNQEILIVDAGKGDVVARLDPPGKLGQFEWSPDGKHLAMLAGADRNDPADGAILLGSAAGGELRNLLPDLPGHANSIAWQDAETLMYLCDEGVWTGLQEITLDGKTAKTILPAGRCVLGGLSLSRDGRSAAFVGSSPVHPPEAFAMRHGERAPRRLSDSNPALKGVRLARQEVVRYKARDGLELEGLLIHPLDEKPGVRVPLIVTVHGGPEAHFSNGWVTRYSDPGQLGAARGFAVFYPNYRGSTGRGLAFAKSSQGDFGGKEFDDIVDGVDHLIASGLVDRHKVGVTGGSYGGYASAWCATHYSERFAAAVMFVGISNQISKFGTTDIPQEMYLVHERKWPWDDWNAFLERSPLYHARKGRTPILILHGKNDPRVFPGQSLELYRALKTLAQTPVRLVLYPGEGHGNRKAAARLDYNLRMMQWFEHYLAGPGGAPPAWELDYKAAWDGAEGG